MKLTQATCLATINPTLAAQWHLTLNGDLTPSNVLPMSGKKVWWVCDKDKDHPPWSATIANRSLGRGCPCCASRLAITRRVSNDNCLATMHPRLAAQWHPTKNGNRTPSDFTVSSSQKVWWQCDKGKDHAWEAIIANRTYKASGCPYCAGQMVCADNCLQTVNPRLAAQWHPTKNGTLTPSDVTPGSSRRKVWWQCVKKHAWQATVRSRSRGSGCPACAKINRKASARARSHTSHTVD